MPDCLFQRYELPIRDRDLLEPSKIDVIFEHVHRVLDCHVMFSIALSDRMAQWDPDKKIGDILYALVSKFLYKYNTCLELPWKAFETPLVHVTEIQSTRRAEISHIATKNKTFFVVI